MHAPGTSRTDHTDDTDGADGTDGTAPVSRAERARAALRRAEELTGARSVVQVDQGTTELTSDHGRAPGPPSRPPGGHLAVAPDPSPAPGEVTDLAGVDRADRPVRALTTRERPALPVPAELAALVPEGIRRGSTATVSGSTSLLLALLAEVTRDGGWVAVVGAPRTGVLAAAQMGVALDRLVLVPAPGPDTAVVVAALLDGMDVVVVGPDAALADGDRRRLASRARERASVLVSTTTWPGAHLVLTTEHTRWSGLGSGHGRLRTRRLTVARSGRGAGGRTLRADVALPVRPADAPTTRPGVPPVGPHDAPSARPAAAGPGADPGLPRVG
ncbi:hypothetical protein [Sanguibacter suaedae]|uniref:hypothetical protein n=1 Tax=Sanguibacter suaedae TaxID=2795737 RepID=UPI001E2CE188|nr:hypothetical protein [Sanguibacter suaedae]